MMNRTFLISFLLVLSGSGTCLSQISPGADEPQKLTLNEALKAGVQNNRQMETARHKVYLAEVERDLIKNYGGGNRAVEIAKQRILIADARFRQVTLEEIAKVQNAYWDLTLARRELGGKTDDLNRTKQLLRITEWEISLGRLAPIERQRVEFQLSNLEIAILDTNERLFQSENLLKYLIFRNKDDPGWNRSLLPTDNFAFSFDPISLPETLNTALQNRAELRINMVETQINQLDQRFYKDQKAALAKSMLEAEQLKVQREELESQIQMEVRNQLQKLETAMRKVLAARDGRLLRQMLSESEERKFETAETETSRILEFHNLLSDAQIFELRAEADAAKALAELQRITGVVLR